MAAGRFANRRGSRARLFAAMLFWSALSLLPDLDVLGFRFGVAYGDPWGHRGATHSLVFALAGGVLVGLGARALGMRGLATGALAALVLASHALLDTLTDGGLGCALLWPFSDARFFAPWRPLPVAPIGSRFLTEAGARVAATELLWFAPLFVYAFWSARERQKPTP